MSEETKPVAEEAAEADVRSEAATLAVAPVEAKPDAPAAEAEDKAERRGPWAWAKAKSTSRRKAAGAFARAKFGPGREVTEAEFDAALEADAKPFQLG